ncbi:MAG: CHASE2 domain-containing protein [Bacteroidota bacterium]|jgi:adenylate cyclase
MAQGVGNGGRQTQSDTKRKTSVGSWLTRLGLGGSLAVLVILLTQNIVLEISPLRRLELSTIDYRFRLRGALPFAKDSSKIVIVELSQETFKSLPHKYPWPHSYYAHLVRNLKRAGALAVGFDLIFEQPDTEDSTSDEDFRKAIRETGFVVLAGKIEETTEQYTVRNLEENYGNIFFGVDSSIGIAHVPDDEDAIYRRYQPFAVDPAVQRRLPSLSFGVLNKVFHKSPFYTPESAPDEFVYAGRHIPKFDNVSILVNFYGPDQTFRTVKFADVIDDHEFTTVEEAETGQEINTFDDPDFGYLYDGTFKNKVVLVGSRMPEDKDMFPVPIPKGKQARGNQMYGVEIHANMIQDVLDGNFLWKEPQWVDILAILLFSLLTFLATSWFKELKFRVHAVTELLSLFFVLAELVFIGFASLKLFKDYHYVATISSPALAVVFGYVGVTVYNYVTERKQKAQIKGMFSRYVSPTVVNELVENPDKLRLGGERRELTVMFSDIEGFTSISESMKPENLVLLLNEYLTIMSAIILKHAGTLDKYEGDAIMAFWGAPIPQEDHALRACRACVEMLQSLKDLRERWKNEGKPSINIRIGLNTGDMIVGNMGGVERFEYTVIGDSVNLGSRLESANKQYHTRLMMSEQTHKRVADHVVARELDMIVVMGKTEPIKVYELIGMIEGKGPPEQYEFLEVYARGLALYRKRDWTGAIEQFEKVVKMKLDDYPSQIYIERSRLYQAVPPPDDWNGVFILRSK